VFTIGGELYNRGLSRFLMKQRTGWYVMKWRKGENQRKRDSKFCMVYGSEWMNQ